MSCKRSAMVSWLTSCGICVVGNSLPRMLPGIFNYRKNFTGAHVDAIQIRTNVAGFIVCCSFSHLVLHKLYSISQEGAGSS